MLNISDDVHTFEVDASQHQANHKIHTKYESLAHLWTKFNTDYLQSPMPRLIVRVEDTFFYPRELMEIISNCSGMPLKNHKFVYSTEASKQTTNTTLLSAMSRYGTERGRYFPPGTLSLEEMRFLQSALSSELMELLHYPPMPIKDDSQDKKVVT